MAAPASTVRQTPAGRHLDDGYSTKVAFARDPNVEFWEKTVKPPGLDGGEAINITTMHNVTYRTFVSRSLITMTNMNTVAAYDPFVYTSIVNNLINQEGSVTCHFPDGSKIDFFGFLMSFEPSEHSEGEFPEATIEIVPTNLDPAARTEQSHVLTSVSGT